MGAALAAGHADLEGREAAVKEAEKRLVAQQVCGVLELMVFGEPVKGILAIGRRHVQVQGSLCSLGGCGVVVGVCYRYAVMQPANAGQLCHLQQLHKLDHYL